MNVFNKVMFILLCTGILNSNIVWAEEAEPELLSAGELLESCEQGYVPGAPNTDCMKYVVGLVLTVMQFHHAEQSPPFFCIDPQVNHKEEVTDNVIAYLRQQSSRLSEDAQTLTLEALTKSYPCAGSGSQI